MNPKSSALGVIPEDARLGQWLWLWVRVCLQEINARLCKCNVPKSNQGQRVRVRVRTEAGGLLGVGGEASLTLALEGAFGVYTATVQTHTWLHTLIHIYREGGKPSLRVTQSHTHTHTQYTRRHVAMRTGQR